MARCVNTEALESPRRGTPDWSSDRVEPHVSRWTEPMADVTRTEQLTVWTRRLSFVTGSNAPTESELVEMGESRTPRPEPFTRDQLRACPMLCRQPHRLPSAGSRTVQSRVPRS